MPKEKPQPKNSDTPAMEMARQSLRRVKEMDMTPEEKEKVMAMIKEAKAEEKVGNKVVALKIYQQLLEFLSFIKFKQLKVETEETLIKLQKDLADQAILKINADSHLTPQERAKLIAKINKQKDSISRPYPWSSYNEKTEIFAEKIFTAEEIMKLVSKQDNININDLRITGYSVDNEGNILKLYLKFGESVSYDYVLNAKIQKMGTIWVDNPLSASYIYKDSPEGFGYYLKYNESEDGGGEWELLNQLIKNK